MIGWLQGQLAEPWQQAQRCGALLICQGVGYEVLLSSRHGRSLPPAGATLSLYMHTQARDDGWTLFGFPTKAERDLFRELVAVSGVGPQMALALLGAMEPQELVQAIVQTDLRRLAQAPGVGRRTAERLSVELRKRLQERFAGLVDPPDPQECDEGAATAAPAEECREEVQITLAALGYEPLEIHRALRAVGRDLDAAAAGDDWIRESLRWLSRSAA
ncbi:MAG: Holliday junction branch migration protein RuvA [Cyanobium sp.]